MTHDERVKRWREILGEDAPESIGCVKLPEEMGPPALSAEKVAELEARAREMLGEEN
jgi:hypothetical protein